MKTMLSILLTLIFTFFMITSLFAQNRVVEQKSALDPLEFSDVKKWSSTDGTLCEPVYSNGCGFGDGFTDFAVEEIENYNSGCADLTGTGWSQYLGLGPAILFPGVTHDFIMQTGYDDQFVTIWVDFNDDFELTEDEIILFDFEMEQSGQLYTASVTIPPDATLGMHYMRARTNWINSCDDPCDSYDYGEAEDYFVIIGSAEMGSIEGWVTELDGGAPVEDALITLDGVMSFTTTTSSQGYYFIDFIFIGEYELSCEKTGYNTQYSIVEIEEDITLNQDFELTQPVIFVDPLSLNVSLPQGGSTGETVIIENSGNGPLDWSASIQLTSDKTKDIFDLQFQYPVAEGGGEAGIETDGNYIYTTKWNTGEILKYDLEGNYLFTLGIGVAARDLAFNGTYFYGSAALTTVYEMDFENEVVISTFSAPTNVRAIAYNDSENVFYANNYGSPVVKFDMAGTNLGQFDVGPVGENYYGFAYDQASAGGPYLWGYAQTGESNNEIIQIQLPSGTETGLALDVKDKLSGPVFNMAGGLYTHPNLVFTKWTLGGLVQNEWLWGLELTDAQTWLWVEPVVGTLNPGESESLTVQFDATDLEPGEYLANVFFTSYPEVGNPVIEVALNVSDSPYTPCDLASNINCTDVELAWSICPAGSPDADSFYIYRNDDFLNSSMAMEYVDLFVDPEVVYNYKVTAFYDGNETGPSSVLEVMTPLPENLEPTNLQVNISGNIITLTFDPPEACLSPYEYNLYRDGSLIGSANQGYFIVDWGNHEYYVTAVYYFGESMPSNSVVITDVEENLADNIFIYPNPASDYLWVDTDLKVSFVALIDGNGKEHFVKHSGTNPLKLNVTDLESGLYFLRIDYLDKSYLRKIIVH